MGTKIVFFDYLRVIAIIAVVGIHATSPSIPMPVGEKGWITNLILNCACRFGVPIFFMISGALFLNPEKVIDFNYLWKKIKRILLAFIVFSFIYNFIWYIASFGFHYDKDILTSRFIPNLIGGWYHLWFLQAIFTLYLLVPILRMVVKSSKITLYFLCLLFFICSFCPFVGGFINHGLYTNHLIEHMSISLPQYSFYFVLGYYLNITNLKLKESQFIIGGGVFLILMIIGDFMIAKTTSIMQIRFSSYMSPFTVLYSSSIFLFFKNIIVKDRAPKCVLFISSLSLGIYLVHDFFLIFCRETGIIPLGTYAFIQIPVLIFLVVFMSTVVSFVTKKIPIIKKIL